MADWLAREGWMIFNWWLLVTLAGAVALPLAWRLLGSLPDRGWLLARPLGLLLIGFVYWLLNSLGFLRNEPGSIALSALIVLGVGLYALYRAPDLSGREPGDGVRAWWQRNRWAIIAAEVVFALMFFVWCVVRAHQHELASTEKPMDLAFLASIMRSSSFPPTDPWLSGYAISYYYFGYVIGAMISTAAGVIAGIGYNLWTAMLFALTGLTAFGVVYNLVRSRGSQTASLLTGLLGLFAVAVMGNYLTPLVDVPYYEGAASQDMLDFWDVRNRQTSLSEGALFSRGDWWWFQSARVLHDRNLSMMGSPREEVINEFPMFSYVLADNHPHVMALPFAVLAMGIGLSLVLNARGPGWMFTIFSGVAVGALIFLNTWDAPIYIALIVAADALRRYVQNGGILTREDGIALAKFGGGVVAVMLIAYFPFLIGFGSQLGGVLPNLYHPTATQQLLLTFGALFPMTILYLAVEAWRGGRGLNLRMGISTAGGILLALVALMGLLVLAGAISEAWRGPQQSVLMQIGSEAVSETIAKRFSHLLTTVLLVVGVFVVAARLFGRKKESGGVPYSLSTGYALIMVAAGLLLVLVPDYVYLRDNFGSRMNTVFKFYYQAWALLGVATAYGMWSIVSRSSERPLPRVARGVAYLSLLFYALGLFYPLYAVNTRALVETGRIDNPFVPALTLNGALSLTNANDYDALVCLRDLTANEDGIVVAEVSKRGSYDYFGGGIASGRLAGITGLPTVIGWQGHEGQWRGTAYGAAAGTRPEDIEELYTDLRLDVVQQIIDRYGIDYIVYGPPERARYGADGELKFLEALEIVCEVGDTRIYRATRPIPPVTVQQ